MGEMIDDHHSWKRGGHIREADEPSIFPYKHKISFITTAKK